MIWLPDLQTENYDAIKAEHSPLVVELVRVDWPEPIGTIYYSNLKADEVFQNSKFPLPVGPVEIAFETEFRTLPIEDGISDSHVDLDFWDAVSLPGGEPRTTERVRDLHRTYGYGHRVEIFYYFPDYGYLVSQWHGQLGSPKEIGWEKFVVPCTYGFRNALQPMPSRALWPSCTATFGGSLDTQAEIDDGDCPYNRHLPGGTFGNLDGGGQPYKSCPKNNRTVCTARIGDSLSYLGFDTVPDSYPNGKLNSIVRGYENNLKRPLRRVYGPQFVDDLDLLGYAVDVNPKEAAKGWVLCIFAVCEGEVSYVNQFEINNVLVGWEHQTTRNGAKRQSKTFFSPNVGNYSGTALAVGRIQGDFRFTSGGDLKGRVFCGGATDIKIYSDETTFFRGFTISTAWVFYDAWTNARWGHSQGRNMPVQDVIDLASWADDSVNTLAADGTLLTSTRSTFVGQLLDKSAQKHFFEMCQAARFTLPFPHRGKTRIMGLSKWENLETCPKFSDRGEYRNITLTDEDNEASFPDITASQLDAKELPFRVIVTFRDAASNNQERPLIFEDEAAKRAAVKAGADPNGSKKYNLLGVSELGQAVRAGNLLLDLGAFDGTTDEGGGRMNNFRVVFSTWFTQTLDLHKYKVIEIDSALIEDYGYWMKNAEGEEVFYKFTHFRICKMERAESLHVKITAQAYPKEYYEAIETSEVTTIFTPGAIYDVPNPGGGASGFPKVVGFSGVSFDDSRIYFSLGG